MDDPRAEKKQGKSIFRLSSAVCGQLGARKTSICQNEWELLHMCSCVGPKVMERQSILWPVWKIKGANKFNMGKVTYVCARSLINFETLHQYFSI